MTCVLISLVRQKTPHNAVINLGEPGDILKGNMLINLMNAGISRTHFYQLAAHFRDESTIGCATPRR